MSCCVPCKTETVYENRKAAAQAAQKEADCQKQLEAALKKVAELEAQIAEAHKNPCCPLFKIESITGVGKEVLVTFDNCTYIKAPMDVVDESLSKAKTDADSAKVEELTKALEALKTKVDEVAAKEDKDTVYDDTAIRNLITALQNKEDKDTVFDPSTLEARITALEGKEDKDTVYDDSALSARVKALEDAPAADKVDTTAFVRKDELVDVQNFAGTVRFKAYPAPNVTPAEDHLN